MAHLSSTGRSAAAAEKKPKKTEKSSDGSAANARFDDRLSVGKRLIKEPGSNPDHTALPNPLVSSPSGRRVARANSQEKTRKPNAAAPESARMTRSERRSVPYMTSVIMGTVIKTEIHVKAPSAPPRHRDALGSASMSATKARSERNTWTERVTADRSATQHRGRQARGIKARKKTQRTDTESLGLQHESRRGSSGARLGTRGTWVSSLPSGVGSYANEGKKPTPTLKNQRNKNNARELCQRDRSTESTNEDIVGLCLARESLRRRDERGHQRSARAFEVVWASSSSRLGLRAKNEKRNACCMGKKTHLVSRVARARPRRLRTHTFGAPGVARCLVVHATRDDVAVSAPHADLKKLALSQFRYTNAMVAGNVTGTSNA